MGYKNGFGQIIATENSDLKYGEYLYTNCNKVISIDEVVPNDRNKLISTNSINYCSIKCRSESRNDYDIQVFNFGI